MSRWRFTKYVLPLLLSFSLISSGFALPALASLAKGSVQEVQTSPPSSSSNSISNPQTIATSETNSDAYFLNLISGKEPATDSASAATAMSTGFKTDDGNIAWLPGDPVGGSLTTIAETLRTQKGFAIGVASTVQFSHATPAAFVSHNVNRNNYADIANEIIGTVSPEVVIGGGHPDFNGGDYRYVGGATTWNNLLTGATPYNHIVARAAGMDGGTALLNEAALVDLSLGDKLIGVFGGMGSNFEYHQASDTPGAPSITRGSIENPTLADVTNATLDILSQDPDGFFVMFEQGDIDWSNHANDFENMIGGVWDLDQAVQAAEEFIAQPGGPEWNDTLVIVTSDHSNSYMRNRAWLGAGDLPEQYAGSIPGGYGTTFVYPDGEVNYRSTNHTNELVTLWARGHSAELFSEYASDWYADDQIIDNTQIYHAMLRAAQEQGVAHILLFIGDGMNIEHEIAGSRYLYGTDQGLTWHDWRNLVDGWGGYVATWDVTTYNKYAASLAQPAYDLSTFDPLVGYDPLKGGSAPYPLQPAYADLVSEPYLYVEMDSNTAITETLTITKTGSANVPWSLVESPAQDWVSVAPDSGFMAFDGDADLSVVLDASGLAPGFYQSHLLVQNPYADLDIPVVLKVRAGGSASTPANDLPVKLLGSYSTGLEGGSEIVTYDPDTFTLYVTNGVSQTVDVLSIADIANSHTPTLVDSIDLSAYGAGITSVDVHNGLLAAAVPSVPKTDNGVVVLLQGSRVISVTVGALPDMVTFTPDGSHLLVANEGEPSEDYTVDPPGTVSIIDVSGGISATNQTDVTTLGFGAYEAISLDPRIRIFGPNASVSQDLEPEYIAVSADSTTAWVTLQENNAIAVIDLTAKQITEVRALGFKDWSGSAGMDASDRDGSTLITNWQVWGLYQPDGIAAYTVNDSTYLVTANEGDSRDYAAYSEEDRVGSATLDPTAFPHAGLLQQDANLGRLKLSVAGNNLNPTYTADPDQDGDVDRLYVYGGRSFSIWDGATGELVFDSGDLLEQITLAQTPSLFNADSGDPAKIDTRSDDKGPEPESVVVAEVDGRMLAFITLERSAGGVMIFEVTHPQTPIFIRYLPSAPGDISPEGLAFVSANDSPTGDPLLVMAHEISGSTTVYELASEYSLYMPLIGR